LQSEFSLQPPSESIKNTYTANDRFLVEKCNLSANVSW